MRLRRGHRSLRLLEHAALKRLDLNLIQILALDKHFGKRDGQAGLHGQLLRLAGFGEMLPGQQSAPDRFFSQCLVNLFLIGHQPLPAMPRGHRRQHTVYRLFFSEKREVMP